MLALYNIPMDNNPRQMDVRQLAFAGDAVVYVMSRDQRVADNHALCAAQALAIKQSVPIYVVFVLKEISNRAQEHYLFMLEGLEQVATDLLEHGIQFVLRTGLAEDEIAQILQQVNAGAVFFDFSPLSYAGNTVKAVAKNFKGQVSVVDTHNIIPAWVVSDKQEYAAHTMRRKIYKQLGQFLAEPPKLINQDLQGKALSSVSFEDARQYILSNVASVGINLQIKSGTIEARKRLQNFIDCHLEDYAVGRNNPAVDQQSGLSPYLHFGQISSLRVVLDIMQQVDYPPLLMLRPELAKSSNVRSKEDGMNALFEELIVRKELADNFCFYNDNYATLDGSADWAKKSLAQHCDDPREFIYSLEQWENATTHDDIWNAAQSQLRKTGKMHGYMRMYWAKKILEWSASPAEAVRTGVYLNDKYSLDGGDPNGYAGILWSMAGLHDRPWFERSVYGKIRYMNDNGLRRKFDVSQYIRLVYQSN